MADFIIENITDEEEENLNQHPEIEWYINDMMTRDIFVYSKKTAGQVLNIIGRINHE